MKSLIVAAGAKADLRDVRAYSQAQWGRDRGDTYVELIISRFAWLMGNSRRGGRLDGLIVGLRRINVRRRAVVYFDHSDSVEILRVLHQQMDFVLQLGVESNDER